MSFDPNRRLVYFGSHDMPFLYAMSDEYIKTGLYKRRENQYNLGVEWGGVEKMMDESNSTPDTIGHLNAFDPITGEKRWSIQQKAAWNGGVLATAGDLVFQGNEEGFLVAFDSDTGDVLWQHYMFSSMVAPPISYEIDGQQYVSIMTGAGGGFEDHSADEKYGSTGRLVVFTLGGKQALPIPVERNLAIPEPPPLTANAEDVDRGRLLFGDLCGYCHMPSVFGRRGNIPDLRYMSAETHELWPAIVLGGLKSDGGMASFADVLSAEDAERIRQYLIARAGEDKAEAESEAEAGGRVGYLASYTDSYNARIGKSSPLIRTEPADAKKTARSATCSGSGGYSKAGTGEPSSWVFAGNHCATPSVAVSPGAIQFTLMLSGPQQTASDLVRLITAALAAP